MIFMWFIVVCGGKGVGQVGLVGLVRQVGRFYKSYKSHKSYPILPGGQRSQRAGSCFSRPWRSSKWSTERLLSRGSA